LSAPMVVKDGWLLAATDGKLTARRTGDGSPVWTVDAAAQRERAAISGDVLFVPMVDGRLAARNLLTGQVLWELRFGGQPEEPLVLGDDLFVGAADKRFYRVDVASGEIEWTARVGATIRGRASSDGERVYFAALDNLIRAFDRVSGAERWRKGVPFRPLGGPMVAGGSVFVAGPGSEIRVLVGSTGATAGTLTFPGRMPLMPGFLEAADGAVLAAVTGGLEESWKLSVTLPAATAPVAR
jgi:outer membrane protein assembly factor BamB